MQDICLKNKVSSHKQLSIPGQVIVSSRCQPLQPTAIARATRWDQPLLFQGSNDLGSDDQKKLAGKLKLTSLFEDFGIWILIEVYL